MKKRPTPREWTEYLRKSLNGGIDLEPPKKLCLPEKILRPKIPLALRAVPLYEKGAMGPPPLRKGGRWNNKPSIK